MKTIIDLIKDLSWEEVRQAHKYLYPEDKNNYESVFAYLQTVRKRKHKDPKEFIKIISASENLKNEGKHTYYHIATNKFSMSLRKWSELANILISPATLEHRIDSEILAHFIWEITFYGNEKDMKEMKKEITKRAKSVVTKTK